MPRKRKGSAPPWNPDEAHRAVERAKERHPDLSPEDLARLLLVRGAIVAHAAEKRRKEREFTKWQGDSPDAARWYRDSDPVPVGPPKEDS